MSEKIELYYNITKSINDISEEIVNKIKLLGINVDSLIIQLPIGVTYLNEDILEQLGDIDIFTTNTMTTEENNKITIIVNEKAFYRIAVDGPSASGKSTISKLLSEILGIYYLDTGAMYRAITYYLLSNKVNIDCEDHISELLDELNLKYFNNNIVINNEILVEELRTTQVTNNVSKVSGYLTVRNKLVQIQRDIASNCSIILDGRDIGTVVLPESEYKFYIDADAEVRARRRMTDSKSNLNISYEEILDGIKQRDFQDSTREHSPLKIDKNAIYIDSSNLSIQEVIDLMLNKIRGI